MIQCAMHKTYGKRLLIPLKVTVPSVIFTFSPFTRNNCKKVQKVHTEDIVLFKVEGMPLKSLFIFKYLYF